MEPGTKVEVQVFSGYGFTVKKTAVYLIHNAPIDQNMEQQTDVIVSGGNGIVSSGNENVSDNSLNI